MQAGIKAIVVALLCGAVTVVQAAEPKTVEDILPLVQQYCGSCHAVPSPALLPKNSWPYVIDSMVTLAKNRTGQDFIPAEAVKHIKALYFGSSPEALPKLPYIDQSHPTVHFSPGGIGAPSRIPQILNIQSTSLGEARHSFLVSDGEGHQLLLLETEGGKAPEWRETVLAEIDIPITARVLDYTGDGREDILVADLGEFPPNGMLAGKLFLLEQHENGDFEKRRLMHQLGRVSDVQALDLDQDGDLDLAVAVFGGGDVGEVFWLEREADGSHKKHDLLGLSGALNITPADLNSDGKIDLLTLVAQEHETLVAFINQGKGRFERKDLVSAGHPLFGSTRMEVVDFDRDGDPDVLFTNGDAFDTQTEPKPYHGVQWLENKGDLKFAVHDIGRFYGAANATAGDMDGDGDLDVVASSWANYWEDPKRQSLIWFENNGRQQFQPRPVSGKHRGLVSLELVDITGNGRLDIVTGAFRMDILTEFFSREDNRIALDTEAMREDKREPSARLLLFKNEATTP
ncbi:FG-GAP repeat domain-containing protein [Marinimicrobium agarilyticum]|uniref:FG-GAP repeat domain-containing protein n=1 Tax=Marinimicrobium agarilyticum TaxID=306546 RepID=UPI0004116756|nr:VCBS repeat-containing protein [Marinimicrobium agarilyticum]